MPNMPGGQIAPLPGNSYGGPLPGPPQAAAAPAGPSRVLMLNNLLTAANIWDDHQYQEASATACAVRAENVQHYSVRKLAEPLFKSCLAVCGIMPHTWLLTDNLKQQRDVVLDLTHRM